MSIVLARRVKSLNFDLAKFTTNGLFVLTLLSLHCFKNSVTFVATLKSKSLNYSAVNMFVKYNCCRYNMVYNILCHFSNLRAKNGNLEVKLCQQIKLRVAVF